MADYKRFVSYMYEYENGVKKGNVGYVRVETRNGECRFTIHMQLDGLPEGIFPTYLIHRPTEEMDLVYLGDSLVKNQIMDSKLNAKEYNTMDSGHRFSDMGGVLLFLNSGVFYATEWDDKPVVLEEVLNALKPKSKLKSIVEKPNILEKKPVANAPILIKNPMNLTTDTTKKKVDILGETQRPAYILPGGGYLRAETTLTRPKTPTNPWELVDRYKKSELESKKFKELDSARLSEASAIDNEETAAEKAVEKISKQPIQGENPLTARIFANYPRIYPFEDNEITRCVKVEPKDIGTLPSDTWVLSNNSFLLHGYYCYHHLIFAEIIDSYGSHYILGVPGIYHNRERFMARMFGFECFKSIRKRELKQGDFGYWYLEVKF